MGMLAVAFAALLVVPLGTANAAPRAMLGTGDVRGVLTGTDYDTIHLQLNKGTFKQSGDTLMVRNALGVTTERISLTSHQVVGKTIPMKAVVASDAKSVDLKPQVAKVAHPVAAKHNAAQTKAQAWNNLVAKANNNLSCATPSIIVGAIVGGILGFLIIIGAFWGIAAGAAVGAYIGYNSCRGGETIRAFWTWWNTP
jgi:uncharacterized protein YcfJ